MGKYSIKVKDGEKSATTQIKENGVHKKNVSLATIDHFFMKNEFKNKEEFLNASKEKGYRFSEDAEVYISYKYNKKEKKLNVIYDHCDYIEFLSKYYCIFKRPGEFNDVEINLIRDYEDIHQSVTKFIEAVDEKTRIGELIPRINDNKELKTSLKICLVNYSKYDKSVEDKGGHMFEHEKKWLTVGSRITKSYKFIRSLVHGDKDKDKLMEKLGLPKEDVIRYNKALDECLKTVSQSKEEQTDMFNKLSPKSESEKPSYPEQEFDPSAYPLEDIDDVIESRKKAK